MFAQDAFLSAWHTERKIVVSSWAISAEHVQALSFHVVHRQDTLHIALNVFNSSEPLK